MRKKSYLPKITFAMILLVAAIVIARSDLFKDQNRTVYLTEKVKKGSIDIKVHGVGEVNTAHLVTVGAQVSGKIENIQVALGDYVKQGDVIAEIDATTQSSELEKSKSRLQTYKAQLLNHIIAANIARAQYRRERTLYAEQATSKQDLENAEKTHAQATAELESTKSLIRQEEVAISKAHADLGYTRIVAPMSGTIISLPVEAGQTVNANQTTPTIALMADLNRMEIKVQISEGDITKVKKGMPVSFYILSEPENTYATVLHTLDPADTRVIDSGEGRKSSSSSDNAVYYYGRLLVDNTKGKLRIGMTAHCTISIAKVDNVLRVPSLAINNDSGKSYVRVLDGSNPVQHEVTTGLTDGMFTEVIAGLKEDDKVITAEMTQAEMDAQIKKRQR